MILLLGIALADTVRVGLFVGNNIGFGEDEPLQYAEAEAGDMERLFIERGDLDKDRSILLQGEGTTALRNAIYQVEAIAREASADGDDVMLVFYYSGHASRDGLHIEGTLFPMDALRRWLEGSTAQVRVALLDACESGALARDKGGQPVDTVSITVDDALTMSGLVIITSTGPLSVAREGDAFGGGVFSRALMTGLRGSADQDGDGQITVDEAYAYAFAATVTNSAAAGGAIQKPEYSVDVEGVGQVVLTRMPEDAAALVLPPEAEGTYTIVSVRNGQVVARVEKEAGTERRVNLPTGRYVVRKVRREDVLLAEVDLAWGGERMVEEAQMQSVPLGDPMARGDWILRPYRVSAHLGGSSPFVLGNPWTRGAELEGRALVRPWLAVVAGAGWEGGSREEWNGALHTDLVRAHGGLMLEKHTTRADWSVGGGLEAVWVQQAVQYVDSEGEDLDAELSTFSQLDPGLWVGGGVHVPVGPRMGLDAGLRAHMVRAYVNDQWLLESQVTGMAGLSMRFGRP